MISDTLDTVQQEIVNVRHALLDLHLASTGLINSVKSKAINPDLVDVIINIRTILELKINPTPSFNEWERISPKSWIFCLKYVIWAVNHENVAEEQRKEINELRQWINTNRGLEPFKRAQGFLAKLYKT